jgi:hypothetical protein
MPPARPFESWELIPAALVLVGALVLGVGVWTDRSLLDLGLAYRGGVEAWQSGHPEILRTWMSTSFLAMVMAVATRFVTEGLAVKLLTSLNLMLLAGVLAVVWGRLRHEVTAVFWWLTLAMAAFFAPVVSTLFYKQFNLIAFALALGGFALIRSGHSVPGSALTGLSICIKPVAILLPFALLLRRDTRRSGLWILAWIAFMTAMAQGFLAIRAHDTAVLAPFHALTNFSERTDHWIRHSDNFSPIGMLYRLAGPGPHPGLRVLVTVAVLLLGAAANDVIRDQKGTSWELFSFACLLSVMVGPISWTHYQLFLAPMFLLLAYRFSREGASVPRWILLVLPYLLADLTTRPLATVPGALVYTITGVQETFPDILSVLAISQFAQYFLLASAWSWFSLTARRTGASIGGGGSCS